MRETFFLPDRPSGAGSGRCTIVADHLVDGSGAAALADPAVTIDGGRVVAVERRTRGWARPEHELLDLTGCTLLPGLIDAHCHLALQPELDGETSIATVQASSEDELLEVMRRNARSAALSGVTTLRDCGSPGGSGVRFRDETAGDHAFPRVLAAGRPLTTPLGHCHWMGLTAETAEELRAGVRELVAEGVDLVKVMASGGMMTASSDPYAAQYTAGQLAQLVGEARRHGRRVAAHALSAAAVRAAVAAPVDTLEHCVTTTDRHQDYDPSLAPAIAAAGIVVGVTAHRPLRALLAGGDLDAIHARLAPHRHLRAAGVALTVHSDAGTPGTRFDALAESVEIFRHGLETTVEEAVQAATATAARALGIEDDIGTVAPGYRADLLAVDGDLLADIRALRRVACVLRGGTPQREEIA